MLRLILSLSVCATLAVSGVLSASPKQYHHAKKALSEQKYTEYRDQLTRMGNYVLRPVLESQYLLKNLDTASTKDIESFLSDNSDVYASNRLRIAYLNQLLKKNSHTRFVEIYKSDVNDISLECTYINYWLRDNSINDDIDERIEKLWLSASSRPDSCNPVFSKWNKLGKLTDDRVWQRIALAMNKGRYRLASYLAKQHLSSKDKRNVDLWIEVKKNPAGKLGSTKFSSTALAGEIIADGLEEIARGNPADADKLWNKIKASNPQLEKFDADVYAGIGFRAAINHRARTTEYMKKASFEQEKVRHWAIRGAARELNWQAIIDFFPRLSETERSSVDWRYWQARALENTGKEKLAQSIYREISTQRDYYSFLAADKVDSDYQMNNYPITEPTEELENSRAFQLARELYEVEDASYMRRQWQWAIRNLDNQKLKAAAKIASNWGFHDRAIITAGRARYFDDVDLRFPLVHKRTVTSQARHNQLPQAYVYGIMRQESAFIENVKSSAGALGLMQIMPATGKLIWKKQKKSNYRSSKLLDPDTNIAAGSFYLRDMLNLFDGHYALATAAYNAGPRRPKKWRANRTLDADIWIENIPFKETRGYVKNVFTYKIIYDHQLGNKDERISQLLPRVNAG